MMGVAHVAIQFPLYEAFKQKMAERHSRDPSDLPAADLVRHLLPALRLPEGEERL